MKFHVVRKTLRKSNWQNLADFVATIVCVRVCPQSFSAETVEHFDLHDVTLASSLQCVWKRHTQLLRLSEPDFSPLLLCYVMDGLRNSSIRSI